MLRPPRGRAAVSALPYSSGDRTHKPLEPPTFDNLAGTPDPDGFVPPPDAVGGSAAAPGSAIPLTFGPYRRGEVLHESALGCVCRCEGGPVSSTPRVVKVLQPSPGLFDRATLDERVTAFLAQAELQRRITIDQGATHWAAVHAHGRLAGGAYAVSDFLPWTSHRLVVLRTRLKPELLNAIVDGIMGGLLEMRDLAGRAHGKLRANNVLMTDPADRKRLAVRLTDPAADIGPDGEAADLRAIGALIYELVLHEPVPHMFVGPVAEAPEWAELGGSEGKKWRGICDQLLFPNGPQFSLDELDAKVRSGRRARMRTQALTPAPKTRGTFGGRPDEVPDPPVRPPEPDAHGSAADADGRGWAGRLPAPAKLVAAAAVVLAVAGAGALVAWKTIGSGGIVVKVPDSPKDTKGGGRSKDGGGGDGIKGAELGGGGGGAPLSDADRDKKVGELIRLSDAELGAGRFDGALSALAEAQKYGRQTEEVNKRVRVLEDARAVAQGNAALAVPDLPSARRLADQVLKRSPDNADAMNLAARIDADCKRRVDDIDALLLSGQPDSLAQARAALLSLKQQAPWYAGVAGLQQRVAAAVTGWVEQADRAAKARRFEAALAGYDRAAALDPDWPGLDGRRNQTLARAAAERRHGEAAKPADAAVAAGDWQGAAKLYADLAAADPANEHAAAARDRLLGRIRQMEQDAGALESAGQLDAAAAMADSLLARDSGNAFARALRARAREKAKQQRAAASTAGGP
jgi:hypothetical protein